MLCNTIDSLCLHPHYSRLLLLKNLSKEEIKRHLLADRYYFRDYELRKIKEEDGYFPRSSILEHGDARFEVILTASDLLVLHALGIILYKYFRRYSLIGENFFFSPIQKQELLRRVAGWGLVDSIIVYDVHTIINELDRDIIKMKVEACVLADQAIFNLIYSFIDLPSISAIDLPLFISAHICHAVYH